MALTKDQSARYMENLKDFKAYIEDLKKEVTSYKVLIKKNTNKALDPYYQISLVLNSIKLINTCININEVSIDARNLKAEDYLNIARKEIYSVLSAMEKVVGNDFENGLDENRELLDKITEINPAQRLNFLKSFRAATINVIEAYGQNSKWRWSWAEIYFKFAVLCKNFFDFRANERENSLDNPYYYIRKEHYNLIIESANFTAQEYRTKFDLSTTDTADLKKCISMLELNRKIFQITGNTDDLEKTKNIIESLNNKVEAIENDKNNPKKKKK
jgi:hypothetical protein